MLACELGWRGRSSDVRLLVYYNNPKTPEEAEATAKQIIGNGVDYGPWVANAEGNSKRQQWIDRMRALAPDAL